MANHHGSILEEDHYYAYGLKIAGISSRVMPEADEGFVWNKNLFNDKEIINEADLDWYDYGFRNYDPQIGRFVQLDPMTDDYRELTAYQYASCEPIANVDLDGLEASSITGAASTAAESAENAEGFLNHSKTLTEAVVTHAAKKAAVTGWSITGNFLKGVGQSLLGTVKGVGQLILHPINAATNIAHAVANPVQTFNGIKHAIKDTYTEFKNGDANTRSRIVGKLFGDIGQAVVGGPIADALKGAEEGAQVAKLAEEGETLAKAGEASDETLQAVSKVDRGASGTHTVPCGCFLPGTLVLTDSGYKRIELIRPGDIVLAYNDTTHTYGRKKVIRIFEHIRDTVYQLRIGEDVINTTSDHPFFVGGRWLRVKNLHVGDSVLTYSGAKLVIASISLVAGRVTVHNFEVADYHTYYVSRGKVLVHNNGPCDVKKLKAQASKQYPQKAGKTELHHPDPKYMGGPDKQTLVPLDAAYHQGITNEFRKLHPFGSPKLSQAARQAIMKKVYKKFPLK